MKSTQLKLLGNRCFILGFASIFGSILCLNGLLLDRTPEACGVEALRVFDLRDGQGNDPYLFEQVVATVGKVSQ